MNLFSLFAVLLLVAQALVPVPRQTSNSSAAASSAVKSQRKGHDAPTAPSAAVVDPTTAPSPQTHGDKQGQNDDPHTVDVRELPPVAIKRDLADWGLWVFTGLLVAVGAAQALYVAKTLKAIKEQSRSLKRQNDMIVAKERARLSIEVSPHDLRFEDGPEWSASMNVIYTEAKFTVTNLGATKAFNVLAYGSLESSESKDPPHPITKTGLLDMPNVIKTDINPIPVDAFTMLGGSGDYDWIEAIKRSEVYMHFSGMVTYEDIFGNGYETRFRYVWNSDGMDINDKWVDTSHWIKSTTDNHAT